MQTDQKARVLIIEQGDSFSSKTIPALQDSGYSAYCIENYNGALGSIYNEPPDLILLYCDDIGWHKVLSELKRNSLYGHLPVITIIGEDQNFNGFFPDDFVRKQNLDRDLLLRVKLALSRATDKLDANPLTRLPGNYAITHTVQRKIDINEDFALVYVDIDNFKAFNDKYGFSRGDDAIRMTARILGNVVRRNAGDDGFVGHIGGDDFVFIIKKDIVEQVCKQVITHYDMIAPTFYDDEDREQGCIQSVDREGAPKQFPLLSVSLSVVFPNVRKMSHSGEAAAVAGELKKEVKKSEGSNYLIDPCTNPIA